MDKKYYGERIGTIIPGKCDFEMLKKLFMNLYIRLDEELYFQEATGYYCTNGDVVGLLGGDIGAEIYLRTGLKDVWPIRSHINDYEEVELFTMIEFLYEHVSAPTEKYYHSWNSCGWHVTSFNKEEGKKKFVEEINKLFKRYEEGYYLTESGEIHIVSPAGLESLIEEKIITGDTTNIDNRIQYAISKFLKFESTINEKKDAVRTLADVLEYYKKAGNRFDSKDDSDLFNIINGFDIRHHNKLQQSDYDKEFWYEWMFYTFLASINVLAKKQRSSI